jgi:hypothetical protein
VGTLLDIYVLIYITAVTLKFHFERLIVWCLTPTLAVYQLYRGVNKSYTLT